MNDKQNLRTISKPASLEAQWKALLAKGKEELYQDKSKKHIEAYRREITDALLQFLDITEEPNQATVREYRMGVKQFQFLQQKYRKALSEGTLSAVELGYMVDGLMTAINSPTTLFNDPKMFMRIIDIRETLSSIGTSIGEVMEVQEKEIDSIYKKFERLDSGLDRLQSLDAESNKLRRRDMTKASLDLIKMQKRLKLLERSRTAIAGHLQQSEAAVDQVLSPLREISQWYDHEMSNLHGRLTDYLNNAFTIIDTEQRPNSEEDFMSKVEALSRLLNRPSVRIKNEGARPQLIATCDSILKTGGNGIELIPMLKRARGIEGRVLEIDEQIKEAKNAIMRGQSEVRSRDTELDSMAYQVKDLRLLTKEAASRMEGMLRQEHGIELRIEGRELKVVSWPYSGVSEFKGI
ncbi:MAG TPA: hypothetical protein VND15_03645 [Candidatus Acidoferrales bacterium]|nr:hypothetical protein [Candidatus Acidoferrales bacterium]